MKWSEAKKDYENFLRLEKSLSNNSIVAYINDINKLILFLDREYKKVPPEKVKVSHLNRFIEWINSQGVSPRTQARTISGIKSFYKFLLMEEKITVAPTAMLESPKVGKKLPDILSIEEIDLLINSVDISKPEGLRNRAILETLYSCGLRVSELVELKISDLFLSKNYIKVEGKGGKERLVPISGNAIDEIEKYINEYRNNLKINNADKNILFLNRRGSQLSRVMVFTIVRNLAQEVGLDKKISPHTFRHSFATHLVNGGADLRAVQEMLGHESILTTEIYTHLDSEYLRSTVNQYHPQS